VWTIHFASEFFFFSNVEPAQVKQKAEPSGQAAGVTEAERVPPWGSLGIATVDASELYLEQQSKIQLRALFALASTMFDSRYSRLKPPFLFFSCGV
jgi:hypothetical protein